MFEELPEPEVFEESPSNGEERTGDGSLRHDHQQYDRQTGVTAPQAAQHDSREWARQMALLNELCAKGPVFADQQTEWEERLQMHAEDRIGGSYSRYSR